MGLESAVRGGSAGENRTDGAYGTGFYRLESNVLYVDFRFLSCFLGCITGGLELTVEGNVGILVETGVGFESVFGLGSAFANSEIMGKETQSPFKSFGGMGMFEGVCLVLSEFDEFAIGDAGCRPGLGEMVGVELEKAFRVRHSADNDVFAVFGALFDGVN